MILSALVVVGVATLAFFYVRLNRQARLNWLKKVNLVGRWQLQTGGESHREEAQRETEGERIVELSFLGTGPDLDAGQVTLTHVDASGGQRTEVTRWQLVGHTLTIEIAGVPARFELTYFKPGHIALDDAAGQRGLYLKVADNVVALRSRRDG